MLLAPPRVTGTAAIFTGIPEKEPPGQAGVALLRSPVRARKTKIGSAASQTDHEILGPPGCHTSSGPGLRAGRDTRDSPVGGRRPGRGPGISTNAVQIATKTSDIAITALKTPDIPAAPMIPPLLMSSEIGNALLWLPSLLTAGGSAKDAPAIRFTYPGSRRRPADG